MVFCPQCGQDNENFNKFCDSCGARMAEEETSSGTQAQSVKPRRIRWPLIMAALGFVVILGLAGYAAYWYLESQSSRLVDQFQYSADRAQADQEKIDILVENPVNPASRPKTHTLSIRRLLGETSKYDGQTVNLTGTIVMSKTQAGDASLIYLDDGTGALPVLWFGPVPETGVTAKITGEFSKKAQAVDADSLTLAGWLPDFSTTPQATVYWSTIALAAAATITLLSEVFFFFRRWRFLRAKKALAG